MSEDDINTLIDMGFTKERVERALQVTNFKGVEPAMEWLLAHSGEEIQNAIGENVESTTDHQDPQKQNDETVASTSQSAKSLKCNDCNKLFRDQTEVEFHAAKTGHCNFSESTEEKKPLTEEEKKQQLAMIEEKLKQKRAEREEQERLDNLEREKKRIQSGKGMLEAKKRLEELEMKKLVEQKKREKDDERVARERVRAQIEEDKAARKLKLAAEKGLAIPPEQSTVSSSTSQHKDVSQPKASQKEYSNTRIQIRLQDGSTLIESFSVKESLSAVRVFIQMKQGADIAFGLMTTFPRKVYTEEDFEKQLDVLGLVPSAVLIVTKALTQ